MNAHSLTERGLAVQGRHPGWADTQFIRTKGDYPHAIDVAEKLHQDHRVVEPNLQYMLVRARSTTEMEWAWAAVESLAQALTKHNTLTKRQAWQAIRRSHVYYPTNPGP
jgi:hypothetical protein